MRVPPRQSMVSSGASRPDSSAAAKVFTLKTLPGSNWSITGQIFICCSEIASGARGSKQGAPSIERISPVQGSSTITNP